MKEKTPFGTVDLWNAFRAASTGMEAVKPEVIVTMARIIEALRPEITLTPHQLLMAMNYEIEPQVRQQYPDLFTAPTAAEAVEKLGRTITLHADTNVTAQGWQQGDPRLDIP